MICHLTGRHSAILSQASDHTVPTVYREIRDLRLPVNSDLYQRPHSVSQTGAIPQAFDNARRNPANVYRAQFLRKSGCAGSPELSSLAENSLIIGN